MNPKKIWSNMGVSDLERTSRFYTQLGFKPNNPHTSNELVSFFAGENDFVMHFFLQDVLGNNIKAEMADSHKQTEVIFTLSADSREQVNDWAKEVDRAGGKLVSQPEEFGRGYYGFVFADPDGHRFNVFYM